MAGEDGEWGRERGYLSRVGVVLVMLSVAVFDTSPEGCGGRESGRGAPRAGDEGREESPEGVHPFQEEQTLETDDEIEPVLPGFYKADLRDVRKLVMEGGGLSEEFVGQVLELAGDRALPVFIHESALDVLPLGGIRVEPLAAGEVLSHCFDAQEGAGPFDTYRVVTTIVGDRTSGTVKRSDRIIFDQDLGCRPPDIKATICLGVCLDDSTPRPGDCREVLPHLEAEFGRVKAQYHPVERTCFADMAGGLENKLEDMDIRKESGRSGAS